METGNAGLIRASASKGREWLYLVPTALLLFVLPMGHTTALRMVFLVLTAAAAAAFWRNRGLTKIPLVVPFAICFLVALASLPGAADAGFSFEEIKKELGYGLIVFLAFYSLSRTRRDVATWVLALLASVFVMGIYALYQAMGAGTLRFDGLHGGSVSYSVFVAMISPLLLVALVYPGVGKDWKIAVSILILLSLFTTYFTGNRNFWFAISASTVVSAALYLKLRPGAAIARFVVAGTIVVLLASALAFSITAQQRVKSQAGVAAVLKKTAEKDPRSRLWAYGFERIRQSPLMGTGFGRMAQAEEFAKRFNNKRELKHAHNIFLDYGIQMGIPGILAFSFLFVCVLREFFRLYRTPDMRIALIGIAGISLLVAVMLKSMTDNQFVRHHALMFWALVGMGLGYGARLGAAMPGASAPVSTPR